MPQAKFMVTYTISVEVVADEKILQPALLYSAMKAVKKNIHSLIIPANVTGIELAADQQINLP